MYVTVFHTRCDPMLTLQAKYMGMSFVANPGLGLACSSVTRRIKIWFEPRYPTHKERRWEKKIEKSRAINELTCVRPGMIWESL